MQTSAPEAERSRLVRFSPSRFAASPQARGRIFAIAHRREQLANMHGERGGELIQRVDGRVFFPAFHTADIGPINAAIKCQPLLRDCPFDAQPSHVQSDKLATAHDAIAAFYRPLNHGLYPPHLFSGEV